MKKTFKSDLHENREILSAAFYNSPYAQVLSRIEDGMIFVVNDAFLNLFGLQSENVIG